MHPRFAQFPAALASRCETTRLGPSQVPALLAHPDWEQPAPVVLWMHGRSVNKELDPGRYLRWIRAGIAACAVDLPGHGERADAAMQTSSRSLEVVAQMVGEIDGIVAALGAEEYKGVFDLSRIGIGGMSAGGMVALRRLCEPHTLACAAVEGATGDLRGMYLPGTRGLTHSPIASHDPRRVEALDPASHLDRWRPIPLLALHSKGDQIVPFQTQLHFIDLLRAHYEQMGADPTVIELQTWDQTGAPQEHSGFGRFANDAKNAQTAFFERMLKP